MAAIDWRFVRNVLLKALLLFAVLNLLFALGNPLPWIGRISGYNILFPGRLRLPYGDDPAQSYNLTLTQMDAMFASHEIGAASDDEFRVFLLGDSAIWGFLQPAEGTLTEQLNRLGLTAADGRPVRFYNFGYPTMSWLKDVLLLERAMGFEPDLILWFVTLESGTEIKQLDAPLLQYNATAARALIERYELDQDSADERLIDLTFWEQTIVGQRKLLADLIRHQVYGALWEATGVDQYLPDSYTERMEDLPADNTFQDLGPEDWRDDGYAFDVLSAGFAIAGEIPVVLINEPMFISTGENSDIRYNFYYPRWVYDDYRSALNDQCMDEGWSCVDIWDLLPGEVFTDSAIHYTPEGARMIAEDLLPWIEPYIQSVR